MLELKTADLKKETITTLIIPVCEDKAIHSNRTVSSLIKRAQKLEEFAGKKGETAVFYAPEELAANRVILMGLGESEKLDPEALRALTGKAVKKAIRNHLSDILVAVPSDKKTGIETGRMLEAMLEGGYLGNHIFDRYRGEKKETPLTAIGFHVSAAAAKKFAGLPSRVETICAGTVLAREWVSVPANDKKPEHYAASIAGQAEEAGLGVTVLDDAALAEKKFGAMLAVGQGSAAKPRLVILEYKAKRAKKTVALVGKGVTFDSGGLNLKVGGGISNMKMDMAGSAAVAATMMAVARLKPAYNVVGIMPLVENMPSGTAIHTGDIVTSYAGKTVEISNTDAEGRLILIDAIAYAIETWQPDTLIDLATLTGACAIALGEKLAGVFSPDDGLARDIVASGGTTHERCWQMPLPADYKDLLKSDFADINNMSSSKWGGAIAAALFLSEFVRDTRWAHIDMAGPAYATKGTDYCGPGGTGFGVRLLCDLLEKL
ncbi:leucyl aminopeptidase [Desulfonema ishimotonii]|uniref:Probable cytosol aminopeptidase n=1 Tax=Desulfonema ishimotonii TaxID=45657 RepID=A0A401G0J9_9BACT|nr:leucyl aminopeptidase [Desulfonema ishimotonii]GBC62749.1 leucyl aminopeptidase [Desulfonema ishimotonii]